MKGVRGFLRAIKDEKGFNLMEVALAMVLIGGLAVLYLSYLATGSRAIIIADERATAESLARAQLEYVRQQDYINYSEDPHDVYLLISTPADYIVELSVTPFDPETGDPYSQSGGVFDQDVGIQDIAVLVKHIIGGETKDIFTLDGYRAYRQ
jgi:prepilin-type N-terminal cleavage/methylation domain-containing protein